MPAILTHDFFGRDVLDALDSLGHHIATSNIDERDAFLLGNQGPDPLFFVVLNPSYWQWRKLGSRMHKESTSEIIHAFSKALDILHEDEHSIGQAYVQGFLGHHALDSRTHPLIYWTQYAICDAGIEGLTRSDGHEVHSVIERELDEMLLYTRRGQTIREYPPADNTLEGNARVLAIIQKLYAYVALSVFGLQIPPHLFPSAIHSYRSALRAVYSPSGVKRLTLARTEKLLRGRSFVGAFAHRANEIETSWFANPNHTTWENPYTGEVCSASFDDLYHEALEAAIEAIKCFEGRPLTLDDARNVTREVNFSGEPTVPLLTIED